MKTVLLTFFLIITTTFAHAHPGHIILDQDLGHFIFSIDHGLIAVLTLVIIAVLSVRLRKSYRSQDD